MQTVFAGEAERQQSETNRAYYQAYMSGLFSQPFAKSKFPPFEKYAPWKGKSVLQDRRQLELLQKQNAMAMTLALGGTINGKLH